MLSMKRLHRRKISLLYASLYITVWDSAGGGMAAARRVLSCVACGCSSDGFELRDYGGGDGLVKGA